MSVLLSCALLAACSSTLHNATRPDDLASLRQVVEDFRVSILEKDKPRFTRLFFSNRPELITWQSVLDDPSLRWVQNTRPQALKARHRPDNNFMAFIDGIVESKASEEERFSDVKIDTDGEIASISFDYVYLTGGRPSNRGREMWLLVRTEQGWKITSVLYSVRLPEADGPSRLEQPGAHRPAP